MPYPTGSARRDCAGRLAGSDRPSSTRPTCRASRRGGRVGGPRVFEGLGLSRKGAGFAVAEDDLLVP